MDDTKTISISLLKSNKQSESNPAQHIHKNTKEIK